MPAKRKSNGVMFYVTRDCWVASWYTEEGHRRVIRLPKATDKETAQSEYENRTVAKPEIVNEVPVSGLQTLINVFERQKMPAYRAMTKQIYRQMFGLLRKAHIKDVKDFTAAKLRTLQDVLMAEKMGPATQHKMLRHARRFMRWAEDVGYIEKAPKFSMPRVRRKSKGRPLTDAEFEAMLAATDGVYHLKPERAAECKRLLQGLWLSGLRVGEADLSWDDREGFHVDWQSFKRPVFVMPDTVDKTAQSRVFPMVPEFWKLISATPEDQRTGPVFNVLSTWRKQRLTTEQVSRLVQRIGEKSGVIVEKKGSKVKYASAHDLRRSFALRWAQRVNSIQLSSLMRHSDPQTTNIYYLGIDSSRLLEGLWD